jgi:hypothetical protein
MNVKELIEKLQTLDPELMVVRDGYEGGVDEVSYADVETIALNVNEKWYYGKHETLCDYDEYEGKERVKAVRIT